MFDYVTLDTFARRVDLMTQLLRKGHFDKVTFFTRRIGNTDVDGTAFGRHNLRVEGLLAQVHLSTIAGVDENGGDGAGDLHGEAGRGGEFQRRDECIQKDGRLLARDCNADAWSEQRVSSMAFSTA